jgi:hypothetical protein
MCHSNKINVPLKKAIKELKMISHGSIPKAGNAIQLRKHKLKEPFPTPHVVPKNNPRAITQLESRTSRKLLPPSRNEFPKTHLIRPKDFIRALPTPLTTIFNGHYLSPKSLSFIGVTP